LITVPDEFRTKYIAGVYSALVALYNDIVPSFENNSSLLTEEDKALIRCEVLMDMENEEKIEKERAEKEEQDKKAEKDKEDKNKKPNSPAGWIGLAGLIICSVCGLIYYCR
jgi:hypothetical protein